MLAQFFAVNYNQIKNGMTQDAVQWRGISEKVSLEARVDSTSIDQFLNNLDAVTF